MELIKDLFLLLVTTCVVKSMTVKPINNETTFPANSSLNNANKNFNPNFIFPSINTFEQRKSPQKIQTKSLSDTVKSFSWILFQESKLPDPYGNLVLSPILIQFLLSILEIAAENETKSQLQKLTGNYYPEDIKSIIEPTYSLIMPRNEFHDETDVSLKSESRKTYISSASGIFLDSSNHLNQTFVNIVRMAGAEIMSLEFNNPQKVKDIINNWASNKTQGLITNLFSPTYDIENADIILTTAIYFRSTWKFKFNKYSGEPILFENIPGGKGIYPEFMETKHSFTFKTMSFDTYNNQKYEASVIEIPYETNEYSMVIVMPEDTSVDEFIKNINVASFDNIFKMIETNPVKRFMTLRMPKFRVVTQFSIVNALLKMGLVNLFTINNQLPYIKLEVQQKISDIFQKAILIVDETGTVAAAASSAVLTPLSGNRHGLVLTIDRPFLSVILDKRNNIPLFISKINSPNF